MATSPAEAQTHQGTWAPVRSSNPASVNHAKATSSPTSMALYE
ncbi:hypothetical protein SALBM135S_01502 [Streptomyces alboniger]